MEVLELYDMQSHDNDQQIERLLPRMISEQSDQNEQQQHIVSGSIKFWGLNSRQAKVNNTHKGA